MAWTVQVSRDPVEPGQERIGDMWHARGAPTYGNGDCLQRMVKTGQQRVFW